MSKHGRARGPRRRGQRAAVVAAAVTICLGSAAAVANADVDDVDGIVAGTPCSDTARACVDLVGLRAWLLRDGQVVRGPLPISIGGAGTATPTGTFSVEWKNKDHRSAEFNNAPMPFAVFFAPGGIAFHQGSLQTTSAGCIRLGRDDAAAFYDDLQVGDQVQVHG